MINTIRTTGIMIITIMFFFLTTALFAAAETGVEPSDAKSTVIEMTAQSYSFVPGSIRVDQGEKIILKITAADRDHGIGIEAYGIERKLPRGETVVIEFTADQKGEFAINCTEWCGLGHFGMEGTLIVN